MKRNDEISSQSQFCSRTWYRRIREPRCDSTTAMPPHRPRKWVQTDARDWPARSPRTRSVCPQALHASVNACCHTVTTPQYTIFLRLRNTLTVICYWLYLLFRYCYCNTTGTFVVCFLFSWLTYSAVTQCCMSGNIALMQTSWKYAACFLQVGWPCSHPINHSRALSSSELNFMHLVHWHSLHNISLQLS